ncbi:conserved hypothetical protein [Xylanimonas cellulosilytica DSM 15894]|uniref:6-phosphogluconolactonase n=1 Tax=Xylanimonas cellulosilytica (strain DSM 15894 / JCM 12276 / CECT 5975 / KCTC 9989 / LMG 20990 / NBRC 107835 / XIL07) TaxID=446471 RepID=D1BZ83_XYLCX|nr:beta-propeller fold lactonase family protein [Xylanimonas cellulosilytica]ACZ31980.1 conserved hypothetical protein [Xylanimonas cellulosilytica DSM 15894]
MTAPAPRALWIGTYPAPGSAAGSGEGVWHVEVDAGGRFGTARLVAETPAPSFLALHPSGRTLYAVAERADGAVAAFPLLDDGALGEPVTVASGGDSPCHLLALDDVLWVANYMDGVAAAVRLDPVTGSFATAEPVRHRGSGTGPRADRQEGPHAHFTASAGDDVLVVDLGADVIRRYPARLTGAPLPVTSAATLPPGTGPRHLVGLPGGGIAVAGELDVALHVLTPSGDGTWMPSSAVPATAVTAAAASGADGSLPSHLTATGDLLLLGVRGADVLAAHRVVTGPDGGTVVAPLADIDLGAGAWPRHHAVLGEAADGRLLVVVAHQGTSDLAAVLVDAATGKGEVVDRLALPTPPACVLEA